MGINASNVAYASADARTGHRFREKLRQAIIQKCANLCSFDNGVCDPSARSVHKPSASSRSFLNLENLLAISGQHNSADANSQARRTLKLRHCFLRWSKSPNSDSFRPPTLRPPYGFGEIEQVIRRI